ncbi:MAG: protein-glutamate O-methyltransferase CheR [Candidatus Eisenbacteria bacterium]|nr:CheR family methyltransferase [Candidatus Eisenbacteria bacterium]
MRGLLDRAGLDGTAYRAEPLLRRARACLRQIGATTIEEASEKLNREPSRLDPAIQTLLLGVTGFFRDPPLFENLERAVAERLPRGPLRVWSAGCSDGSELYSTAMLLYEAGRLPGSFLLGTDCRPEAIERARAARYLASSFRPHDTERIRRHLLPERDGFRIAAPIASSIRWKVSDVLRAAPAGPWDIILCRNLAMYLEVDAAQSLWTRLVSALRPGGLLVTGSAERPGGCRLRPLSPSIFQLEAGGDA